METRKIQKVGGGTYTVSLPKDWAESEDVTAGDVVNLHAHIDGLLVIQTAQRQENTCVGANISHEDPVYLHQLLRAAYAAGTTEVKFCTSGTFTDDQRRVVQRISRYLPGATVVEDSESQVTVRVMLDSTEVSIRQSVRQLQFVTLSMHRDATAALTDDGGREGPSNLDNQADRLFAMIDRHVTRGFARLDEVDALGLTRPELFELWVVARELERVADQAEDISATVSTIDGPVEGVSVDDVRELAQLARDVVEDAVSVIIGDTDVETARRALNVRDHVREETETLDRRLFESAEGDYRLTHVLASLRRTAEHGGNIAEVGLQNAFRRGTAVEPLVDDIEQDPQA